MAKPRNYRKEYDEYQGTPEQLKNRAKRNAARALMKKKGLARKGDGRDVHHLDGNPKNNSVANLRTISKSKNRAIK